jgi:predicted transcriptional regulator
MVFSTSPCRVVIGRATGARVKRAVRESVKRRLSQCSSETAGNYVGAEAEETPLLEAVTRQQLVKTQQTEKLSVCCRDL